jgi:hypothetical protein
MVIAIRGRIASVMRTARRHQAKSMLAATALTTIVMALPTVEIQIAIQILPASARRRNRCAP